MGPESYEGFFTHAQKQLIITEFTVLGFWHLPQSETDQLCLGPLK